MDIISGRIALACRGIIPIRRNCPRPTVGFDKPTESPMPELVEGILSG
jgi:hypothetical protein